MLDRETFCLPTHLPVSCHRVQPRLETKLLEILTHVVTRGCEAPCPGRDVVHEKLGCIQEEHEVAVAVAVEVVAHVVHVVGDAAHLRPLQAPMAQPPQFNALAARVGAPALLDPHHLHAAIGEILGHHHRLGSMCLQVQPLVVDILWFSFIKLGQYTL